MFLAGLKFALGLVAGLSLFAGILISAVIGAELLSCWRKKHRLRLCKTNTRARRRTVPHFQERAVFRSFYRFDDWIPTPDKSEHLQ
jgi:hypothetical protein